MFVQSEQVSLPTIHLGLPRALGVSFEYIPCKHFNSAAQVPLPTTLARQHMHSRLEAAHARLQFTIAAVRALHGGTWRVDARCMVHGA
eukprot:365968-Chlamydomonas_euryale.AAC.9